MIELNFEFTQRELLEAQRRLNPAVRVLSIMMPLLALFFLWLGYQAVFQPISPAATQPSTNVVNVIAAMIPFAFFAVICFPIWLSLRKRLRKQRDNPLASGPRRVMVDDAGIRSVSALSDTFYRWEAIERVYVTKQLYLLRAWSIALIIPKRAVPADQLVQFEEVVRSRVSARTGGFPVRTTPPPLPAPEQGAA